MNTRLLILFLIIIYTGFSQEFKTNGGVLIGVKMVVGNQNKMIQVGVSSFGTANYGKLGLEGGFSMY